MEDSKVNHPRYYSSNITIKLETGESIPIECIDVIRNMPSWKGNAIKYLWRAGNKVEVGMTTREKEIEDLNKAIWYIKDYIDSIK